VLAVTWAGKAAPALTHLGLPCRGLCGEGQEYGCELVPRQLLQQQAAHVRALARASRTAHLPRIKQERNKIRGVRGWGEGGQRGRLPTGGNAVPCTHQGLVSPSHQQLQHVVKLCRGTGGHNDVTVRRACKEHTANRSIDEGQVETWLGRLQDWGKRCVPAGMSAEGSRESHRIHFPSLLLYTWSWMWPSSGQGRVTCDAWTWTRGHGEWMGERNQQAKVASLLCVA
jgi:hypothetical protein